MLDKERKGVRKKGMDHNKKRKNERICVRGERIETVP
jgi:hypothetical protein